MPRMPTGAQAIVALLESEDVEVCFGLPGVHNLPLWEALRESPIRLVGVRHEQTAAYAADGYARATGRVGVALTTTGPGAANTLGAVGEAWASRSPVLVIATDIPSTLRRKGEYRGVLHETDGQADMFRPVTKGVHLAHEAAGVRSAAAAAWTDAASEPARPVYLEVATDLLAHEIGDGRGDESGRSAALDGAASAPAGAARLDDVVAALDAAERPLVWVGGGARDAGGEIARLAERLAAPVITTYGAAGVLPSAHPCFVGLPPHVEPAGRLWDEADIVLAIGSDLDGVQTQNFAQPQPPTLIAAGLEPVTNYAADFQLLGDAAELTRALAERVAQRIGLDSLAARLQDARAQACAALDGRALTFLDAIRYAVPAEAVIVTDMCIPGYWLAGFHTPPGPRRLQVPLGWGTLGYAFPAAIGAALAGRGPAVSISGDGGFLYAAGELATAAQERLPLTAVVVDDGGYGMLRYDQDQSGEARYGVDLHTPDFRALAESFGLKAQTVDGLEDDFGEALAEHIDDPEPTLLVARTPEPLVPPPNTSPNWYRRRRR
jgi:thiamine pyrophosphate-dependent acetolactate synthase large subunit-like protein